MSTGFRYTFQSCTILQQEIGRMDNYLYLIHDHATNTAAVIDPAWDVPEIVRRVDDLGATLSTVLITHSHSDHVNGLKELRSLRTVSVHIAAAEAAFWAGTPTDAVLHEHGDTLLLGQTSVEWLVTPGHTPGSSCFRVDNALIAADTLFMFGCGRCDLTGGDPTAMFNSLQMLKRTIAPDTLVLPGHNYGDRPSSTMAEQMAGNPFLFWEKESDFVQYRMVDHERTRSSPYTPLSRDSLRG